MRFGSRGPSEEAEGFFHPVASDTPPKCLTEAWENTVQRLDKIRPRDLQSSSA